MLAGTLAGTQLAAVTVDAGWVIGGVIVFIAGQVLAGIVAARVTGATHATQIKNLFSSQKETADQLADLADQLRAQNQAIVSEGKSRLECRADCGNKINDSVRGLVDKSEYVRMIGTFASGEREIGNSIAAMRSETSKSLSELHHRVTEVAKEVSYLRGQKEGE